MLALACEAIRTQVSKSAPYQAPLALARDRRVTTRRRPLQASRTSRVYTLAGVRSAIQGRVYPDL